MDESTDISTKINADEQLTFTAIQSARLDKLLVDMLCAYDREKTILPVVETGLGSEISTATDLQRHWQARFKTEYFSLEKSRIDTLMSGALLDVGWSATASDGMGIWMPTEAIDISEVEGDVRFVPGQ